MPTLTEYAAATTPSVRWRTKKLACAWLAFSDYCARDVCKHAGVKIRDRQAVVVGAILDAAVVCPHFQFVIFEVKLDLETAASIGYHPRCKAARANVKRHMPPVVYSRMDLQTDLSTI